MNFSLYRGNLHKVPDVPRRWPLSRPSMSLQVFQKALAKRQDAVNLLQHDLDSNNELASRIEGTSTSGLAVPDESHRKDDQEVGEAAPRANNAEPGHEISDDAEKSDTKDEEGSNGRDYRKRKREDSQMEIDGAVKTEEDSFKIRDKNPKIEPAGVAEAMAIQEDENCDEMDRDPEGNTAVEKPEDFLHTADVKGKLPIDAKEVKCSMYVANGLADDEISRGKVLEKLEAPRTPLAQGEEGAKLTERAALRPDGYATPSIPPSAELAFETWKATRKSELEAKLKQLQETKHQLVQLLKQVLTSEEEAKRKTQGLLQFGQYVSIGTTDQSLEHKAGSHLRTSADLEEGMRDVKDQYPCLHWGCSG